MAGWGCACVQRGTCQTPRLCRFTLTAEQIGKSSSAQRTSAAHPAACAPPAGPPAWRLPACLVHGLPLWPSAPPLPKRTARSSPVQPPPPSPHPAHHPFHLPASLAPHPPNPTLVPILVAGPRWTAIPSRPRPARLGTAAAPPPGRHLVERLLDPNPLFRAGAGREGAAEIKNHPWFAGELLAILATLAPRPAPLRPALPMGG